MNGRKYMQNTINECIATYGDLMSIPTVDNGEPMVSLSEYNVRMAFYTEVLPRSTGWDMYVRENVARKLKSVRLPAGLELEVIYAYRSPVIQERKFIEQLKRFGCPEKAHEMIAAPDVAGHPTGGAVDVWIVDKTGYPIDMGTDMHELIDASRVFNRASITDQQFQNRMILRDAMEAAGFAAYDGEWWHFSYGDKEWAFLKNQPEALYAQINFDHQNEIFTYYNAPSTRDIRQAFS
jgi:D-alanyl-D-alanine dipeptidase